MQTSKTQAIHHKNTESYFYMALSAALVAGMAAMALVPGQQRKVLHTQGRLHPWWHLLAFTVIGYVAGRISKSPYQRALLFVGCLLFGLATEWFEHSMYGSRFEAHDVWVDAIGVLLGTGVALLLAKPEEN